MIASIILAALYLVIIACAFVSIILAKWNWAITYILLLIIAGIALGGSIGGPHG